MKSVLLLVPLVLAGTLRSSVQAQDAAAPAKGDPTLVETLVRAAGGREAFDALPGLRYQVLETLFAAEGQKWRVHHRVPHLVHFTPAGDGFCKSEFVDMAQEGPLYRRHVLHDNVAWGELRGQYDRSPQVVAQAETALRRELFLATVPFSLAGHGAQTQFRRAEQVDGRTLHVYMLRLQVPVVLESVEEISEFLLFVDPQNKRVAQLKWRFSGDDRWTEDPFVWAHVDFEGERRVGGVTLPHERTYWRAETSLYHHYVVEDPQAVELPGPALRRPWIAGVVYDTPDRADHWDPPPKEEGEDGEQDREPGDSDGDHGRGGGTRGGGR